MKIWLVTLFLGVLFALSAAAADESALTNEDIVKLTQAGVGPSVIVAKILSSQTALDTSVEALVELSENEVAQNVLATMLAVDSGAEEIPAGQGPRQVRLRTPRRLSPGQS